MLAAKVMPLKPEEPVKEDANPAMKESIVISAPG